MDSCQNNSEKSYTEKKSKHTPFGYSLFTNSSFDETKNKLDCYRGKDCIERFCKEFRDHAMKIINCEEKEMIPLTDKGTKSYEKQKVCYICKKEFSADEMIKMHLNNTIKSEIIVIIPGKLKELLIVFAI